MYCANFISVLFDNIQICSDILLKSIYGNAICVTEKTLSVEAMGSYFFEEGLFRPTPWPTGISRVREER